MELFTPGPVNIKTAIKNNIINEYSHRCSDFHNLYYKCEVETKKLFNMNNDYISLFLTGSGTLSIESMIYSYIKYKKVLLLQNGFFSEKWEILLKNYNTNYEKINFGWGNNFDYDLIEKQIIKNDYDGIFFVHHETSTTMINDIYKINLLCDKYNIELYADTVSSVGTYIIDLNILNRLVLLGYSSNKGIGIYPGLAITIVKKTLFDFINDGLSYLNLGLYYKYSINKETPFTCCYQNFQYYYLSVKDINDNCKEKRFEYYNNLRDYLINKMKKINIKPYLTKNQCNWVINFKYNNVIKLYNHLEKNKILIYKCKGILNKTHFQVGILNKTKKDIDDLINVIKTLV